MWFSARAVKVKGKPTLAAAEAATATRMITTMLAVKNKKPDRLFVRVAPGTYNLHERSEP